jgi:biopolymer transport protein ExbB
MKELPKDAKLTELFDQALVKLNDSSKVHNEKGNFFLANGEQTKGDILRLGKIASFGHANGSYYMLAPAGKGELKVWKDAPAGADIFKGQYPATFPIFIYEGLDRSAKKKKSQTVLEFVQAGGSIAWVIVGMGVVAMLLCLIRGISLKRYSNDTSKIEDLCKVEDLDGTKESLTNYETSFGQKNLMLKILNFTSADKEVLNDVIDEGMIHEHKLIDRFGAMILVFAAVAPLMGLLGTVTGMISTFDIITEHGTGDPKLLSQGISEALITTELGLIVAIPTLLFGNMLSGWGKNIKMTMDKLVLRLTNEVCKP